MGNISPSEFKGGTIKEYHDLNSIEPLIVIYETDKDNDNLHKLIYTINKYGYNYSVIGLGDKWISFGTKIKRCHEYYLKLNPNRIIIQLDARDVLVNQSYEYLIKLLDYYSELLTTKLIASVTVRGTIPTEPPGTYIDKNTLERKKLTSESSKYYTKDSIIKWQKVFRDQNNRITNKLNAGMILGRVSNFIQLFKLMNIDETEDDQQIMYEVFNVYPELFYLDVNFVFFKNILDYNMYDCNFIKGKITSYNNIKSVFVQTPGKNWECYNKLFNGILNAPYSLRKKEVRYSRGITSNSPLVVSYESDFDHTNVQKLVYTLEKNNYNYSIIGQGIKWQGNGTKIVGYHEYYKTLDPERIVIQVDSRDVLVNQNFSFFNKLLEYYTEILDTKLIISAEHSLTKQTKMFPPGSFVNKDLTRAKRTYETSMSVHHRQKWKARFKEMTDSTENSPNSGLILGRVKNFIKLYNIMDTDPKEHSDQTIMYDIYLNKPELFMLDSKNVFFTNIFNYDSCKFDSNNKLIGVLGTTPVFIQTPGRSWKCYNTMFNNSLNNY